VVTKAAFAQVLFGKKGQNNILLLSDKEHTIPVQFLGKQTKQSLRGNLILVQKATFKNNGLLEIEKYKILSSDRLTMLGEPKNVFDDPSIGSGIFKDISVSSQSVDNLVALAGSQDPDSGCPVPIEECIIPQPQRISLALDTSYSYRRKSVPSTPVTQSSNASQSSNVPGSQPNIYDEQAENVTIMDVEDSFSIELEGSEVSQDYGGKKLSPSPKYPPQTLGELHDSQILSPSPQTQAPEVHDSSNDEILCELSTSDDEMDSSADGERTASKSIQASNKILCLG